ncbi:MAG: NAD(+)/NADH kinase [Clostridiales bacterium]|nr:MAG: NAD(+)/NADH kinase [Clostridiales bacterium]
MHFIIYSGFDRDADISVVKQIQKILDNKKATYSLASYRESGFVGMSYNKFSDVVGDADVVIVVGGDGTVLRAAEGITEAGLETPIFAVNRGQCGFLADTEPEDFDKEIDKVLSGGYELETNRSGSSLRRQNVLRPERSHRI